MEATVLELLETKWSQAHLHHLLRILLNHHQALLSLPPILLNLHGALLNLLQIRPNHPRAHPPAIPYHQMIPHHPVTPYLLPAHRPAIPLNQSHQAYQARQANLLLALKAPNLKVET